MGFGNEISPGILTVCVIVEIGEGKGGSGVRIKLVGMGEICILSPHSDTELIELTRRVKDEKDEIETCYILNGVPTDGWISRLSREQREKLAVLLESPINMTRNPLTDRHKSMIDAVIRALRSYESADLPFFDDWLLQETAIYPFGQKV
jgi:hypothetical protein